MKKILLFYILLTISFHLVAQDEIGKNHRQVKASQHTYDVSDFVNQKIEYSRYVDITDSIRLIPYEYPVWAPKPKFPDLIKIKELIKIKILTELKRNNVKPAENEEVFIVTITDNSGKIKELILSLPQRWQISVKTIEDCMTAIKEGEFEMYYDRTNPFLKNEKVLNYAYPFTIYYSQLIKE